MSNEQTDPQSRRIEVERLFQRNADELRNIVLENQDIMVKDGDNIVEGVAKYLSEYQGAIDDEAFIAWAAEIVRPAARRIATLYGILEKHGAAIRGGIRSVLPVRNQLDDNDALTDEIFQEVVLLILRHIDGLTQPGRAKLSTRLYGLARRHTLDYHVKKARRRHRAVQRHLTGGGVIGCPEVLSKAELDSILTEEAE